MSVKILAAGMIAISISACANSGAGYAPLVDGPYSPAYGRDLADCQQLAQKRGYMNDDVKTDAVIGMALGALLGAADGEDGGALGGAVIGGAAGAAGGAYKTKDQRKEIVLSCMRGRGHRVVG